MIPPLSINKIDSQFKRAFAAIAEAKEAIGFIRDSNLPEGFDEEGRRRDTLAKATIELAHANDTLHAAFRGYPLVEAKEHEEDFYE